MTKTKRIISLFLVLALSVVFFSSCGKADSDAPAGMKLASDPAINHYNLYVPTAWTVDMSTGITSAYVSSVDKSNISVSYGVPTESTVKDFWENNKAHYESVFEEFTVIEEGENSKLGEYDAARYNYTAKYEGKEYQFLQYITIRGAYVFIFTYTAENEENEVLGYIPFDKNLEEVMKIVEEFEFK